MSLPLLVGLSGKANAGKSTVADYLERYHGYRQFAFADALKEVVGTAFRLTTEQLYGHRKELPDPRWGASPRELLQWLGTEVLRARFPGIWIDHLRHEIMEFPSVNGQHPLVVTDVRFQDEAAALRRLGAVLVRIERAGWQRGPRGDATTLHISETELDAWDGWDYVIENNGSREVLYEMVAAALFNGK